MTVTDVHQHVWTEPLVAALARRSEPPRVRAREGRRLLEPAGEPAVEIAIDDVAARARQVRADGLDRAIVAPSCPIGIEALPRDEAAPLVEAYHAGALALGDPFDVWGAVALDGAGPEDVDEPLDRGAVGIALPAGALGTPDALERIGPLLARLEARGAPLLVHPGPAPWAPRGPGAALPPWWAPSATYVAEQAAAWLAFAAHGRAAHPRLRVVFAGLAGLAPLHVERLRARGGQADAVTDPRTFFDTSSYGRVAIGAMSAVVGPAQLVHGSDRPYADGPGAAGLGARLEAFAVDNPARLLGRTLVLA
ncbi:MAG: amidohydrolase family protein [Solirubrobacteraceae bacterium]|nr:amidohydrolase family protein [Solirubrobacteraceae bacterium]